MASAKGLIAGDLSWYDEQGHYTDCSETNSVGN